MDKGEGDCPRPTRGLMCNNFVETKALSTPNQVMSL